jgi:transcriptional regulator with XRE-family HTH domain
MEDLNLNILAERLKSTRKAKKKTQDEVAEAIGVNKYTISDWERGIKQPGILNIVNYCNFLGITLDELLGITQKREVHLIMSEEERDAILAMLDDGLRESNTDSRSYKLRAFEQYLKTFFSRAQSSYENDSFSS